MQIALTREYRIILLKWLKQGYIDTLDIPEAYNDKSLFYELLKESSMTEGEQANNNEN